MSPRNNGRPLQALVSAELEAEAIARLDHHLRLTRVGRSIGAPWLDEDELAQNLAGKDVFIVAYEQVRESLLRRCPDLKLIASIRGGPGANIDIDAATELGIPVLSTMGRTDVAVSEHTFALLLAVARRVVTGDRLIRTRAITGVAPVSQTRDVIWLLPPGSPPAQLYATLVGVELHGKTLGLIGCGSIGRAVARIGQGFGMQVLAYDPFLDPVVADQAGVRPCDLRPLLRTADFVSCHARLAYAAPPILGREQLALMKPTAFLVNTARATIVDEDALIEALRTRRIAGAGLDVFGAEPLDPASPFLELDNVVLTPHLAGTTREIPHHHSRLVVDAVLSFLGGDTPAAIANPQVYETAAFASRGQRLWDIRDDVSGAG